MCSQCGEPLPHTYKSLPGSDTHTVRKPNAWPPQFSGTCPRLVVLLGTFLALWRRYQGSSRDVSPILQSPSRNLPKGARHYPTRMVQSQRSFRALPSPKNVSSIHKPQYVGNLVGEIPTKWAIVFQAWYCRGFSFHLPKLTKNPNNWPSRTCGPNMSVVSYLNWPPIGVPADLLLLARRSRRGINRDCHKGFAQAGPMTCHPLGPKDGYSGIAADKEIASPPSHMRPIRNLKLFLALQIRHPNFGIAIMLNPLRGLE